MKQGDKSEGVHTLQCREIWGGIEAKAERMVTPGLDGWVFSEPYRGHQKGGDVHYLSLCGHGAITRMMVADVSGHGETVAELADHLRHLLRTHIDTLEQTRLAQDVNGRFTALVSEGHFATAIIATYFALDDSLVLCNAGHPRPLWYQAKNCSWKLLHQDLPSASSEMCNLPLGLIEKTGYHQFSVTLEKGDMVLIYTDSLIEVRGENDALLDEEGLLCLAEGLAVREPEQFGRALLDAVRDYHKRPHIEDDLTLLVLYHNAENPGDGKD